MSSKTGSRCTIYKKIDALEDCTTLKQYHAMLKPILEEMAFYMINSEGVVSEDQEEWHEEYTGRLFTEAGKERKAKRSAPTAPPPVVEEASSVSRARPHSGPGGRSGRMPPRDDAPTRKKPLGPMPTRPVASDVPASLRAILDGTHASFRESDDGL